MDGPRLLQIPGRRVRHAREDCLQSISAEGKGLDLFVGTKKHAVAGSVVVVVSEKRL